MDLETERILKVIFSDGIPRNLQYSSDHSNFLSKLGTYKVKELRGEHLRLRNETKIFTEKTQDLAISNYKTFIQTAENSRSIFQEFLFAESQVSTVLEKLPKLSGICEKFLVKSEEISETRYVNTITLKNNPQILQVLEVPQLMERCIREDRYEESLELAGYVQKLGECHGRILVLNSIVKSVDELWYTMLLQLVEQLSLSLQLPLCLQIVGYLRRMQAFGNNELKLKFLQARDVWLRSSLDAIPRDNAQQHLTKTIEVTRINLFNIITQYRAVFPEENLTVLATNKILLSVDCDGRCLFSAWLHKKIDNFLETLEDDLLSGVCSYDTVLGQCMYFGLSFSRVGADFRGLMILIFVKVIRRKFINSIANVDLVFQRAIEKYTLKTKVTSHTPKLEISNLEVAIDQEEILAPPESLLDFVPLAAICNVYINSLNEFRLCGPMALAKDVTQCVQESLEMVARRIWLFYRQAQQAFDGTDRKCLIQLCSCFVYDLIPYVQRCIHAIFSRRELISCMGITPFSLDQEELTYLQQEPILESLNHMLSNKMDGLPTPGKLKPTLNADAVSP